MSQSTDSQGAIASSPAAGVLTEVRIIEPSLGVRGLWLLLLMILVVVVATIVISLAIPAWPAAAVIGAFLLFLLTFHMVRKRGSRAMTADLGGSSEDDLHSIVARALTRKGWAYQHARTLQLVEAMARRGRFGMTLRAMWQPPPAPGPALQVPFEPRLLDESDPAFHALSAACGANEPGRKDAIWSEQRQAWMTMRRNIILKGGWALAIIFGVNFLMHAVRSMMEWRVKFEVVTWGIGLLAILFVPVTGRLGARKQWLLVPGGLALRTARRRSTRSDVHVFDRRTSVLCATQNQNESWIVGVADATSSGWTIATPRELDLLLRAWLSPLSPPPVERMHDFV